MAEHVMMGLGKYRFGMAALDYQDLKRRTVARWPSNKVIGAAPIYQFLGPDDDTLDLHGVIYPEWTDGYEQVKGLRASCRTGEPLPLVSGAGDVFGRWLIDSVESDETLFNRKGLPRRVDFRIALKNYAQNAGAALGAGSVFKLFG